MPIKLIKHIFTGSSLLVSCLAVAADANINDKLELCTGCHGPTGINSSPHTPNLAGQKKDYLIKALNDYRSGNRKDPLMGNIAKGLLDSEIAEIAAFFAGQKVASNNGASN